MSEHVSERLTLYPTDLARHTWMEAYSATLAWMNEVKKNDRVTITVRWKPLARSMVQRTDKSWCKRLRRKGLFKRKVLSLEWNWCEDRASGVEESVAVPSNGGAEGCRSCLGREFQSTGASWVKDLSLTLRRKRTEGRWRVMMLQDRVVRLDWTLRRQWR